MAVIIYNSRNSNSFIACLYTSISRKIYNSRNSNSFIADTVGKVVCIIIYNSRNSNSFIAEIQGKSIEAHLQ